MIINHNMNALNAHRNMMSNIGSAGKSMEKLSSGLRINRAGDDAAGLAISEKMRGQIRGLDQASRNAQDGISMIQTAEGALNETHSILQRMRELSTQAANDTNTEKDRDQIQNEMNQLTSEINRIGNTTEFNTQKVLDGGAAAKAAKAGDAGNKEVAPSKYTVSGGEIPTLDTTTNKLTIDADHKNIKFTAGGKTKEIALTAKVYTNEDSKKLEDLVTDINKQINDDTDLKGKITAEIKDKKIVFTSTEKDFKVAAGTKDALGALKVTDTKVTEVKPEAPAAEGGAVEAKAASQKFGDLTVTAKETGIKGNDIKVEFKLDSGLSSAATNVAVKDHVITITGKTDADLTNTKIKAAIEGNADAAKLVDVEVASGKDAEKQAAAAAKALEGGVDAKEAEAEAEEFSATLQIGANKGQAFKITIKDMRSEALGISKKVSDEDKVEGTEGTKGTAGTEGTEGTKASSTAEVAAVLTANVTGLTNGELSVKVGAKTFKLANADIIALKDKTTTQAAAYIADKAVSGADKLSTVADVKFTTDGKLSITAKDAKTGTDVEMTLTAGTAGTGTKTAADLLKIGTAVNVKGADGTAATEATEGTTGADAAATAFAKTGHVTNGTTSEEVETALDMSSHDSATAAIEVLDNAINKVSTERSTLGAYQNRLEHTINNLGTSSENLTAAESRIRDVDMAKEMMTFSKENILQQAAQAMLAQAKQQPQGVLQLLR